MGMTNREETLDWLYRLRSEIYVYIPKEWLIPMNNALDVAIDTIKREGMLEDWTKKCRKFEADYEARLKDDLVDMLDKLKSEIHKNIEQEDFARSVFLNEEKDYRKANQCTGNLQAYEKVLGMIDNLLKENEDEDKHS